MTEPVRWEKTTAIDDSVELDALLARGWEPFAVTQPNAQTVRLVHLRRSDNGGSDA